MPGFKEKANLKEIHLEVSTGAKVEVTQYELVYTPKWAKVPERISFTEMDRMFRERKAERRDPINPSRERPPKTARRRRGSSARHRCEVDPRSDATNVGRRTSDGHGVPDRMARRIGALRVVASGRDTAHGAFGG